MMNFSFDKVPKLVVDGVEYYGINIVEKLHAMSKTNSEAALLLIHVVNLRNRAHIPRIGFCLEDSRAVLPTKRPIDVGYDITVIGINKQVSDMTTIFETGVSLDIPLGYYVELIPRSSLSKSGYVFANSVGVIDPCYTGTLKVALIKADPSMPDIQLPARVAQIILKPYIYSESIAFDKKDKMHTTRGDGGFGST